MRQVTKCRIADLSRPRNFRAGYLSLRTSADGNWRVVKRCGAVVDPVFPSRYHVLLTIDMRRILFWAEERFGAALEAGCSASAAEVPQGLKPIARQYLYAGLKACSTRACSTLDLSTLLLNPCGIGVPPTPACSPRASRRATAAGWAAVRKPSSACAGQHGLDRRTSKFRNRPGSGAADPAA